MQLSCGKKESKKERVDQPDSIREKKALKKKIVKTSIEEKKSATRGKGERCGENVK